MIRSLRLAFAAALSILPSVALAQSTLLQGGAFSSGRLPMFVNSGQGTGGQVIVQDSGPASGGGPGIGVSELNITARGTGTAPYAGQGTGPNGEVACIFDAPSTNSTGYHSLCFSANVSSGGLISYQANGAASSLPFNFKVNGVTYEFPFLTTGVVGPASSTIGNAACWNNTSGTLLADCGPFVTVGGNNTWTGTNNFTSTFQIGGVTQNFPASGNIVGTSDTQTLTNKSIGASQINSGTLAALVMPALTGDVTSSAGSVATTIAAGVVSNSKLAAMTQNSVKGAATSTAAADLAVPSCSAAANALQWVTNTGFQCGTLGATTAGWGLTLSGGGVFSISTAAPPYGADYPINMGLSASAGGSALTINLTTAGAATPSATNPVLVPFRSTTLTNGTTVWGAVTGALSIVVPSAATLGTSNNVPFRVWIFAAYNAGTVQLGVATCSTASTIYPCTSWESNRVTSTAISGFATSAGTFYATSGVSNDAVRIIGFCDYSGGLATAGAWATSCTTLQVMTPSVKKPGDVVQRFSQQPTAALTTSNNYTVSDTAPVAANGVAYSSFAMTATAAMNHIRIRGQSVQQSSATGVGTAFVTSSVGPTTLSSASVTPPAGGNQYMVIPFYYVGLPSSVSSITYTGYFTTAGGTTTQNGSGGSRTLGGTSASFFEVEEIMGFSLEPANDNLNPGVFSATG